MIERLKRFLGKWDPHIIIYRLTIQEDDDDNSPVEDMFFLTDKATARFIKDHKVSLLGKRVIVGCELLWILKRSFYHE